MDDDRNHPQPTRDVLIPDLIPEEDLPALEHFLDCATVFLDGFEFEVVDHRSGTTRKSKVEPSSDEDREGLAAAERLLERIRRRSDG